MRVFNPDHDLSLANGDKNFLPPASAVQFARDCQEIMSFLDSDSPLLVWGWDKAVKHRMMRNGVESNLLPSNAVLDTIRDLSHRKYAVSCNSFIFSHMSHEQKSHLACLDPVQAFSAEEALKTVSLYSDAILKAPWSGSGKGVRPVSEGSWTKSDKGWCSKTIAAQGSIVIERRERQIVRECALLYRSENGDLAFEGWSLFGTSNNAYQASCLASDGHILDELSHFVDRSLILRVKELTEEFLKESHCPHYDGFIGVDMFICRHGERFVLAPCVEINVRCTMGLVARHFYDRQFSLMHPNEDGAYSMRVLYAPTNRRLREMMGASVVTLTNPDESSLYAIDVVKSPITFLP